MMELHRWLLGPMILMAFQVVLGEYIVMDVGVDVTQCNETSTHNLTSVVASLLKAAHNVSVGNYCVLGCEHRTTIFCQNQQIGRAIYSVELNVTGDVKKDLEIDSCMLVNKETYKFVCARKKNSTGTVNPTCTRDWMPIHVPDPTAGVISTGGNCPPGKVYGYYIMVSVGIKSPNAESTKELIIQDLTQHLYREQNVTVNAYCEKSLEQVNICHGTNSTVRSFKLNISDVNSSDLLNTKSQLYATGQICAIHYSPSPDGDKCADQKCPNCTWTPIVKVYGHYIMVTVETKSPYAESTNPTEIIPAVTRHLRRKHNVTVSAYCDRCLGQASLCHGTNNSARSFKLNISDTISTDLLINESQLNATGPICAIKYRSSPVDDKCADLTCPNTTWISTVNPGTTPTPQPVIQTTTVGPKILGLGLGLGLGVPALASIAAGLIYRKLRKKNSVGDESDTAGILGGTPVVEIEDAPSSAAPAGTS